MTGAAVVVVLVTVVFALAAPRLAHLLPPAVATRVLVPAGLAVTACGVWVLAAVAFTGAAQLPPVSRYGHWSAAQIRAASPFPVAMAVGCALLALVAAGRTLAICTRRLRRMLAARRSCQGLGSPGSLVVLDHDRPDAFATPGPSGRIVVTTALLRALTPDQRRALLAHEASHLAHQHAWWLFGSAMTSAANPLLAPTDRAITHVVERWADEDAAREVTDRRLVARTVAHAALLTHAHGASREPAATKATAGDIPRRVQALLAPPQPARVAPLVLLALLLASMVVATGTMQRRSDMLLDSASIAMLSAPSGGSPVIGRSVRDPSRRPAVPHRGVLGQPHRLISR